VYRYIDALCASGVPIISDSGHNGGYSLLHHFTEAPLMFDLNEQKALIHAAQFAEQAGYPFGDALNQAVSRLKLYTNQEQRKEIERHIVGFDVISTPADSLMEPILQELEVSVADGHTVLIDYNKEYGDAAQTRQIDPYGLVYWKGKWYVIAYCHLRSEKRSFRVDRISTLSRTDAGFERPIGFSARQFFLNNLLPDADNKELLSIRIQGKEQAITDLCGHWLFGQVLIVRSKNEALFKLEEKAILSYLPHYLLIYGKSIQVLEPTLLKERLVSLTAELHQYYKSY
jgi:predicted DNA-binding transcriptional regulator YafY